MDFLNFTNTVYAHGIEQGERVVNYGDGMMGGTSWFGMTGGGIIMLLFWVLVGLGFFVLLKYLFTGNKNSTKAKSITENDSDEVYICPECGYEYKEKEWAKKCEKWCRETRSCNLDIIKHGTPPKK